MSGVVRTHVTSTARGIGYRKSKKGRGSVTTDICTVADLVKKLGEFPQDASVRVLVKPGVLDGIARVADIHGRVTVVGKRPHHGQIKRKSGL